MNFCKKVLISIVFVLSIKVSFAYTEVKNLILQSGLSPTRANKKGILRQIKKARSSIDVGMFIFTDNDIADALCYMAKRKRVKIRMLVDEHKIEEQMNLLAKLEAHGVKIYKEEFLGKMHTKLMLIDNKTILTGSYNWTIAAYRHNFEDLLLIKSYKIHKIYKSTLDKLFSEAKKLEIKEKIANKDMVLYYPLIKTSTKEEKLNVQLAKDAKEFDVYFSPRMDSQEKIIADIKNAKSRITIAMFIFLDEGIANTLINKKKNSSVDINVFLSKGLPHNEKIYELFKKNDVNVSYVSGPQGDGIMHLKCMSVDKKILWTGSANWSGGGLDFNFEDIIRINSPTLATFYDKFIIKKLMPLISLSKYTGGIVPAE